MPELPATAFSSFPSGVAALCAVVEGVPRGFVASSFARNLTYYTFSACLFV